MWPPDDPGFWFWRVVTILILGAAVITIVSVAISLAIGLVKGALDDTDVASAPPVPGVPSQSVVPGDDRRSVAPLLRDVRADFAWLAPPERATNGNQKRVAPARTRTGK